jgi:hypothetical protein
MPVLLDLYSSRHRGASLRIRGVLYARILLPPWPVVNDYACPFWLFPFWLFLFGFSAFYDRRRIGQRLCLSFWPCLLRLPRPVVNDYACPFRPLSSCPFRPLSCPFRPLSFPAPVLSGPLPHPVLFGFFGPSPKKPYQRPSASLFLGSPTLAPKVRLVNSLKGYICSLSDAFTVRQKRMVDPSSNADYGPCLQSPCVVNNHLQLLETARECLRFVELTSWPQMPADDEVPTY